MADQSGYELNPTHARQYLTLVLPEVLIASHLLKVAPDAQVVYFIVGHFLIGNGSFIVT